MFVSATKAAGAPSLRFLQEPALSGAEGAGGDAADTNFCSSAQTPLGVRSWFLPFANCAKDGAPSVLFVPRSRKAWATRH
jgi:hypothetical protein